MANLISRAFTSITSVLKKLQVKSILSVVLLGVLLLTTNAMPGQENKAAANKIDELVHNNDSFRPKTVGDFKNEVEGDVPLNERVYNTARDSAQAFKDFGSLYPDTADRSARNLDETTQGNLNKK